MRKVLLGVVLGILLIGLGSIGTYQLWQAAGRQGAGDLDRWIGRQVIRILGAYITPTVEFASIDYQAPRTVVLHGLILTAESQTIIAVDRVLLELVEIPRVGQPIRIEQIELDRPRLRFVRSNSGGFIGWSHFLRKRPSERKTVPPDLRLSEVLRIRHVAISSGQLTYDPGDGGDPMTLSQIDTVLDTPADSDDPAWHMLEGRIKRDDLFLLTLDGRINLDTGILECRDLRLTAVLGQEQYEIFPPPVQEVLRRHQVCGRLGVQLDGRLFIRRWRESRMRAAVELTDGSLAFGRASIPLDLLRLNLELANGMIQVRYTAELLEGSISGTGSAAFSGDRSAHLNWEIRDVKLRAAFSTLTDTPPPYTGRLASKGTVTFQAGDWPGSLGGGGELHIEQGRMVQLPIMRALAAVMLTRVPGLKPKDNDRFSAEFRFQEDHVDVEKAVLTSSIIEARGKGKILYDGRLDLRVRAGLVNRLRGRLGRIGSILDTVTDNLVTYLIRGTLAEPQATISPRGLGSLGNK